MVAGTAGTGNAVAERDAAVEADTATSRALGAVLAIEMNLAGEKNFITGKIYRRFFITVN